MATYTLGASDHGAYRKALVADVVDIVQFARHVTTVEVVSDGSAAIYVTVDGSAPSVGGGATWEMPAIAGGPCAREITVTATGTTQVRLISSGTPTYSVAESST